MAEFTPGLWEVYQEFAPHKTAAFQTHDHPSRFWQSYISSREAGLVARSAGATPLEAEANARLIAEAPELLEVCKAALKWLYQANDEGVLALNRQLATRLHNAIDGAEGR